MAASTPRRDDKASTGTGRNPKLRRWAVSILIFLIVYAGAQWYRSRPLASGPAPALKADLTSEEPFALSDLRGEPVLVYFWATWCPVCKLAEGSIEAMSEHNNVITLAMQSGGAAAINQYLGAQGRTFDTIADPAGEIAAQWGVPGVPATFIVDGNGRISFRAIGYTPGPVLQARIWAARHLK